MATAAQSDATAIAPEVRQFIGKRTRRMLIDGKWVEAASGKTLTTFDPATEEPLAEVPAGEKEDIDRAVRAARRAFEAGPWRTMTASERGRIIWRFADLIEQHAEEFAQLETLDNGKPISVARAADVPLTVDHFRYYAGWATKIEGETIPVSSAQHVPQLHLARAGRRRWADHSMELPDADGGVEARSRACLRQHRGAQTRRADAAFRAAPGRAAARSRRTPRGREHRHRLRRNRRRSAGGAPRRRQGRIHGLDRGRTCDHARGCRQPEDASRSSSEASPRTSSSPMPISTRPPRAPPWRSSSTMGSAARLARGFTSSRAPTTRWCPSCSSTPRRSRSAQACTQAPRWAPSYRANSSSASRAISMPAGRRRRGAHRRRPAARSWSRLFRRTHGLQRSAT